MLTHLGKWCAKHHWLVIAIWLGVVIGAVGAEQAYHGKTHDVFTVPGSGSQNAIDLLNREFPAAAGTSANVVFEAPEGRSLYESKYKDAVDEAVDRFAGLPNVSGTVNPFTPQITALTPQLGGPIDNVLTPSIETLYMAPNERTAYSIVTYGLPVTSLGDSDYADLVAAAEPARAAGLSVDFGGPVPGAFNQAPPGISQYSEAIGLVLAVIILLIALGSFTSMAVPIGVGLVALTTAHSLLNIVMRWVTIGSVAPILGTMIGLGVGIDYSLFIVSRYRQNLAAGLSPDDAVGQAIGTSGAAVLFAAITVAIALCGLAIVGIPYLGMLGFTAAAYVAVTVVAALTLVPAVLGLLGPKINSLRIHRRDETADTSKTVSARWARATTRRPAVTAAVALIVLLLIAAPVLHMRLGFLDDGDQPTELTQRRAFDAIAREFGPGETGPLLVAIKLPPIDRHDFFEISDVAGAFIRLENALTNTAGVKFVSLPAPNRLLTDGPEPTAAIVQVVPDYAPNAPETKDLVRELRRDTIPDSLNGSALDPAQVYVGGTTAVLLDLTDGITSRLAPFIAIVIVLAFLLLMVVFRSIYVPATAAIMNLLSIGAAYGILVAVFQDGWGMRAIGLNQTVPIVAFVPVMMFAILFGLSMDYEVFLISRIKDEYDKTGDNHESVVEGVGATARVITSAALIMIAVFLAFVANPDPTVKMIGLGMAAAVFIDASIVRMMLVPPTVVLGGRWTWWLPERLDNALPMINIEGESGEAPDDSGSSVLEDYDGTPLEDDEPGELGDQPLEDN